MKVTIFNVCVILCLIFTYIITSSKAKSHSINILSYKVNNIDSLQKDSLYNYLWKSQIIVIK